MYHLQVMMLFRKIQALADEFTCELSVSYIEIYNEILKDLLCPGTKFYDPDFHF